MLMILAGAIFACLLGLIYLLWTQRTIQKQIDNIENELVILKSSKGGGGSSMMPPLEDVIAHYEKQLGDDREDDEGEVDEMELQEKQQEAVAVVSQLDTVQEVEEEDDEESDVSKQQQQEEKVVIFGQSQEETNVNMKTFSSVLSRELKELCKRHGFSPKGNKKELIMRLMNHPKYKTEEELLSDCKELKEVKHNEKETETSEEVDGSTVIMTET